MTEAIKRTLRDVTPMRWFILFLVSGLMFATYWFQDFYSGLKPLMETQLGITSTQFSNVISATTLANLIGMIILGGIILDKWGIRITVIIFGSVAVLGGLISALGASDVLSSDPGTRLLILTIGRIFFGIGLEITCVIITRTIVKWFKGYELALAMAINMGIGRLGSTIGTAISPDIGGGSVAPAVTFAATLIGIGFILFIIYLIFDVRIDKQQKEASGESEEEPFRFSDLKKLFTNKSFLLIAGLCVAFYSAVFPFMQYAPDLLINEFGFSYKISNATTPLLQAQLDKGEISTEKAEMIREILDKRQVKEGLNSEILALSKTIKKQLYERKDEELAARKTVDVIEGMDAAALASLKETFSSIRSKGEVSKALQDKLDKLAENFEENNTMRDVFIFVGFFIFGICFPLIPSKIKEKAGKRLAILIMFVLFIAFIYYFKDILLVWLKNGPKAAAFLPLGTIFFTPIFGRMVDKKGKAASIMLLGAVLLIFSHTIFAFFPSLILCYISLFTLGVAFSLVPAAMWPSVAKIVPERRLGTAYAAMFTIQNWGLFLFFKGIGTVLDWVNPTIVETSGNIRDIMTNLNFSNSQISETILFMRDTGEIASYNYTVPISLFIICGVVSIFLAIALKKSSAKHGLKLEEPSNA